MASFFGQPLNLSEINLGLRFESGDIVTPDAINAPIEACAYLQEKLQELIDKLTSLTVGGAY